MLNESNIPLEEDGIEEEILVDEEVAITKAMWGDVGGNIENQTDLQNALDAKQDSLTEAQLNAVNSGITSEKVTTYDGYADQIASKADQSALNAESTARGEADTALGTRIDNEVLARQQTDNGLQSQIDAITSKSDVVDVVANYAALQAYDTSTLGNNDVVKVLDDETHEDALTYYRWSTTTQTWSYIGQEAPYYSKGQMDVKLAEKQDKLTAGANIQIQNGTISATDTKYTNGNGLNLNGTEFSADTDVLATKEDLEGYYTKPETDNLLAPKLEAEVVAELPTTGTEGKLYLTPKAHTTSTATGNPIEATVTEQAGQLESFQLDGDTYQQTYTGKNLCGIPDQTFTLQGVTVTVKDGEVTINGTSTGAITYIMPFIESTVLNGNYSTTLIYVSGSRSGASNTNINLRRTSDHTLISDTQTDIRGENTYRTYSVSNENVELGFYAQTGVVFNNLKFKIQIVASSTPDYDFEPYVGGQPSPSPAYPQPIQTVTGEQTVVIQGKNLFRAKDGQYRDSTLTVDVVNGVIHVYGRQHASYDQNVWIPVEDIHADGTYTLTMNYSGSGGGAFRLAKGKNYQAANNFGGSYYAPNRGTPVTASATNITYDWILIYLGHGSSLREVDYYINPQFESGSLSTSFSPYSKHTYPINLGDIQLCGLGDDGNGNPLYKDRIYRDGDDWKVHKATATTTLDGSEAWYNAGGNAPFTLDIDGALITTSDDNPPLVYCDKFYPVSQNASWGAYDSLISTSSVNYTTKTIRIRYTAMANLSAFRTWLSSNNTTLYYALATATDTTITDTALIAQLEAIRTASLQNGANTITNSATAPNLAGDMEIGYYGFNPTNRYDKWLWLDINNNYEQIGS